MWVYILTTVWMALTFPSDAPRFGVNVAVNVSGVASTSRGLVGDTVFAVIPNIKPIHTFIATITFQAVRILIFAWHT